MGGHNIHDDRVKSLVQICLTGNASKALLKGVGIKIGKKMGEQFIKNISFELIKEINRQVGFRLLTKFGGKGAINLWKGIPIIGGVVGGTFDGLTTRTIGKIAKKTFIT